MSSAKKRRRPLPSVDDAISVIKAYARFKGWTRWRLAKEARMHDTTLRDFDSPLWSPTVATLRILYALIPADFDPATAPPDPMLSPPPKDASDGPHPQG